MIRVIPIINYLIKNNGWKFNMKNVELGAYLRKLVIGVGAKVPLANGEYVDEINFDNAATTPPFFAVMKEIMDFAPWYSSIHRGTGHKSMLSSDGYEQGREVIKVFVHADPIKRYCYLYKKHHRIN